ncbi:MAG: GLPGLI family protein [Bacteroidales bacterium]|jgi:GLPGLI family protein|nr:GLPGLI family protein [Bacteroidales bacterium]
MKKISIGFLILIIAGKTFSQQVQFTSKVFVTYDMYIMFMPFPYNLATLYFNNSEALFSYTEQGKSPNEKLESTVIKGSDRGDLVKKINKAAAGVYISKENSLLLAYDEKQEGYVIDSIQQIKWKYIENKTKKIADYDCFMAEGYFRGCYYTVWYTPDIPSSFGPWKLNGCPGLILEVTRDDGALSFYATQIIFEEKEIIYKIPSKYQITYAKGRQDIIDFINKTNEKTMSQIGRDGFIPPLTIQCLECDFLDDVKRYPGLSMRRTASWDDGEEKYIEM